MLMKSKILLLQIVAICVVSLFSCNGKTSPNASGVDTDSVYTIEEKRTPEEIAEEKEDEEYKKALDGCHVIPNIKILGDIKMGCSKEEFTMTKNAFLREHPTLNGLKIKSIDGYFSEGKLYMIVVFSEKYSVKDGLKRYWTSLYREKYREAVPNEAGFIMFCRNGLTYEVSDENARYLGLRDLPVTDYNERLRYNLKTGMVLPKGYQDELSSQTSTSGILICDRAVVRLEEHKKDQKDRSKKEKELNLI